MAEQEVNYAEYMEGLVARARAAQKMTARQTAARQTAMMRTAAG